MTWLSRLLVAAALLTQGQTTTSRTLRIDFVALDGNGRPVRDLTADDVEVWIGQFRAPVRSLTASTPETSDRGRLIVLLLDDMTLRLDAAPRAREAARRLVSRMGPDDRAAIVTLTGTETRTTDDRATLLRAIDAYAVRAAPVMRSDTLGRHVLETLASISRQLTEAPGRRKTIVGIGSGGLFDRPLPPPAAGQDLLPEWVHAMRQMAFANVNFYVIDPAGVGSSRVDNGQEGFARETGGRAFLNTNDLSGAADRILAESATYYLAEVPDPPVGGTSDLRELNVKSLRRGVSIRARHAIPGSGLVGGERAGSGR